MMIRKFEMDEMKKILNDLYRDYLKDYDIAIESGNQHKKDMAFGTLAGIHYLMNVEDSDADKFIKELDEYFDEAIGVVQASNLEIGLMTYYVGKLSAVQNVRKLIEQPLPWVFSSNPELR